MTWLSMAIYGLSALYLVFVGVMLWADISKKASPRMRRLAKSFGRGQIDFC